MSLSVLQGQPCRIVGRIDSHAAENALIGCGSSEFWAFLPDRLKVASRIYVPVNGAIDDARITNDLGLIGWATVRQGVAEGDVLKHCGSLATQSPCVIPPSMTNSAPLQYSLSSEARNSASFATSTASATRP